MQPELVLYDYWRSSAAYRVRIALNLKGLDYRQRPVHLVRDGGEQKKPAYRQLNPQGLVPALKVGDSVLTQSLAIIDWLEETCPRPALLPADPLQRAQIRAMAQSIVCDIHPLNNLRVMVWLKSEAGISNEKYMAWYHYWIQQGFAVFEAQLATGSGLCCQGDQPGLADVCLVPQVYNAERFRVPMEAYPRIRKIVAHCRKIPAFERAVPENQADAEI